MCDEREPSFWLSSPHTVAEAIELQLRLRELVIEQPLDIDAVRYVAGADVSFERSGSQGWAGIVVMRLDDLQVVEEVTACSAVSFPYVPGLLSFRESPLLLNVWQQLRTKPDVVLCDAHGKAHPRRFGMACHFGLMVDAPTVGCAKNLLFGVMETMSPVGDWVSIEHLGELVGAALYTQPHVRPVFVSVGHKVDLPSAIEIVRRCVRRHRLPEPLRLAHELVTRAKRSSA